MLNFKRFFEIFCDFFVIFLGGVRRFFALRSPPQKKYLTIRHSISSGGVFIPFIYVYCILKAQTQVGMVGVSGKNEKLKWDEVGLMWESNTQLK